MNIILKEFTYSDRGLVVANVPTKSLTVDTETKIRDLAWFYKNDVIRNACRICFSVNNSSMWYRWLDQSHRPVSWLLRMSAFRIYSKYDEPYSGKQTINIVVDRRCKKCTTYALLGYGHRGYCIQCEFAKIAEEANQEYVSNQSIYMKGNEFSCEDLNSRDVCFLAIAITGKIKCSLYPADRVCKHGIERDDCMEGCYNAECDSRFLEESEISTHIKVQYRDVVLTSEQHKRLMQWYKQIKQKEAADRERLIAAQQSRLFDKRRMGAKQQHIVEIIERQAANHNTNTNTNEWFSKFKWCSESTALLTKLIKQQDGQRKEWKSIVSSMKQFADERSLTPPTKKSCWNKYINLKKYKKI